MNWPNDALEVLKQTSRTFYIPIVQLPGGLQEAVTSAYLCMRAIDEIEDHPHLDNVTKAQLLRSLSLQLQTGTGSDDHFTPNWGESYNQLPEVTVRVSDWAKLAPDSIAPRIWDATAAMADRMAIWAERNWTVNTVADLDSYTFSVAGAVGLLLSDLWAWYDNTQTSRMDAIGFGRGLQTVNILRNHREDKARGVDFFPDSWTAPQMQAYARHNLEFAERYTQSLPKGPALDFCRIPLVLAQGTLKTMALGKPKLSRDDVMQLIGQVSNG
ncbi:phytoene/squalene synthase family protein [Geitlerinema sp. P-1104]|uniref:squalene/phytoene synthase family protein n=1 Tax=Geitlerinema sp. P-1104 TaxID=2546230 RepID=UPI001476C0FE|nr:phytoene/squalene synthase family protein [Geitlerinema sp. P-1104]NMG60339.1 phytoene/squalene synthase family protein [Geitlerinema sp. P-1104]